jgi:TPR repeat protein
MDEPLVETEVADSEPQRRSGPWKLIIVVAVLTLIAAWLIPTGVQDDEPETADGRGVPLPAHPPSLLGEQAADGSLSAQMPATAGGESQPALLDDRPGAKARALIASMRAAGGVDLDQVLSAAEQAQSDGELANAYLLYFFAAREGSGPAALELGKQADPATRDPLDSVFGAPDLNQAYKWYKIAAGYGESEARDRLADLQARVEQMAAGGDPQAQRISLLWQ